MRIQHPLTHITFRIYALVIVILILTGIEWMVWTGLAWTAASMLGK